MVIIVRFDTVFYRYKLQRNPASHSNHAGPVRSLEKIRLDGGVSEIIIHDPSPTKAGAGGIDEDARGCHKVRVTRDIGLLVHPGHDLLQKALQLGLRVGVLIVEGKLRDPDGATLGDRSGLVDKVLEVGGASELVGVPVDVDEVDGTASAIAHKPLKVGEAGGRTGIGDGWCS